ncbi:MAG: hypothetical protein NXH97_01795 [Rhodobacteraceae bacterium]|nr:hypothetical protein [Paracoccaceae bacterium]
MQIENIKDDDSLRAWLIEQDSYEVSVTIAARAALRVQPWLWARLAPARPDAELTALLFVWSTVTSALAPVSSTADVRNAARAAFAASDAAFAAFAASSDAASSDAAFAALWDEIRRDAQLLLKGDGVVWGLPLWQTPPERLAADWVLTGDAWRAAGAPWDRFARIFDDFWDGRAPDWAYLEQIVLIDPEAWKAGPKAIAEAIAKIDAKTEDDGSTSSTGDLTDAFKRSANAERVVFNEETKKFRLEPLSDLSDSAAADCIEILSNVLMIFDFEDPASNQYRAVQEEWELIRLAVDRYANRPRMLYSTCMRVSRRLTTKFASGECPDPAQDANIGDFHLTIMGVATELRSRDPEVQEALFNAERVNLQPLLARDEEVLEKAVTEVSEISEGALADELPIDLSITLDPSASAEDQRDARLALGGRLIRVFVSCYRGFKASLTEVEQVTKSAAGIATNSAKVTAAVGGITMPLWLEKAVAVVQLWF